MKKIDWIKIMGPEDSEVGARSYKGRMRAIAKDILSLVGVEGFKVDKDAWDAFRENMIEKYREREGRGIK